MMDKRERVFGVVNRRAGRASKSGSPTPGRLPSRSQGGEWPPGLGCSKSMLSIVAVPGQRPEQIPHH